MTHNRSDYSDTFRPNGRVGLDYLGMKLAYHSRWAVVVLFLLISGQVGLIQIAQAQVEPPTNEELFEEDKRYEEERESKQIEKILDPDKPRTKNVDFSAPELEFLQETNQVRGSGGVLISRDALQVQADSATMNTETNDADLDGSILITWPEGTVRCEEGEMNLDTETGEFRSAGITIEDGAYDAETDRLLKLSETDYRMFDTKFSTCHCPDGSTPWFIGCSKADVEEEGYAYVRDASINLFGAPIFYSPYFVFPVKTERASGLLLPEYGYSSKNGIKFSIPLFLVLDDYSDLTFTPFIETLTRRGTGVDYREAFSKRHHMESRLIYSDESPRDGDLRGTIVDGLYDPTFDDDRFGGFYNHYWRSKSSALIPSSLVADLHLVSDDLFLREIEDDEIGRYNSRYTTSRVLMRSTLTDFLSSEIGGEFNQAMIEDDDLVFQRLPELSLNARKSFRPFGFNPYGFKVSSALDMTATDFVRQDGYDGWRYDLYPNIKVPHHYKNYLNAELATGVHKTFYDQRNDKNPFDSTIAVTRDERLTALGSYTVGTALERVYEVERGSVLETVTGLGVANQAKRLRRVKHVIEPTVGYSYVPKSSQEGLPLYDSLDRIRNKSLFSVGVRSSLLGRFTPANAALDQIPELSPEVEDLPKLGTQESLADLGSAAELETGSEPVSVRQGEIRELAVLNVRQTYDYIEAKEDNDPLRDEWSDVAFDLGLYPTPSYGMLFESDIDTQNNDFSTWAYATHVKDDRGDVLRARYTFVDDTVSQLEAGVEVVLSEQLRAGYYARFDEQVSEFLENQVALRISSGRHIQGA